ncbi:MAG: hypothetical protein J5597_04635 [Spirochaetaceae bacterium]|nr:hypothetical protein [Spirochaetaceae bacterium]MBP5328584.1 hypothetical protein [Spirochaetaceae bacterium]
MKRKKTKRPNRPVWYIFGFIVVVLTLLFRKVKIVFKCSDGTILEGLEAKKKLLAFSPPYIIVGNHHSIYDHIYLIRAFFPRRINFIVARKHWLASKYLFFVRFARTIPKSLFQPDLQTVRGSFDVISNKGILALYPEGQIVINGISKDMPESCSKLIKKAKLPVFVVKSSGNYLCDNPWRKNLCNGIINLEVSVALTPEQIEKTDVEEIDKIIAKSIYVDSFAEQERTGWLYKGHNRAEGLTNILYMCPCCKKELTLKTKGNDIFCTECGTRAEYTETGHLDWKTEKSYFKHIGMWYNYQRDTEKNRHLTEKSFDLQIPVKLAVLSASETKLADNDFTVKKTKGIEKAGDGILQLTEKGYTYIGKVFREETLIHFDPSLLRYIPFTPGSNFQIYLQDVMFAFFTKDPRMCAKVALVIETYNELLSETQVAAS